VRGQSSRVPMILSRDGATVRLRAIASHAPVEPARHVRVQARRDPLRISGSSHVQGKVSSHLGVALPRVPGRPAVAPDPRRCRCACGRRLPEDPPEMIADGVILPTSSRGGSEMVDYSRAKVAPMLVVGVFLVVAGLWVTAAGQAPASFPTP